MEPKSGWRWFTLRQFAEKYGFEYAYIGHHRETGELKVKYLHDVNGIKYPTDYPPEFTLDLPSEYTVVLYEEAERFVNEHRGTFADAEGSSETDPNEIIERLRSQDTPIEKIVVALNGKGFTLLQIGRALELGESRDKKQIAALKSKVSRLKKKGTT